MIIQRRASLLRVDPIQKVPSTTCDRGDAERLLFVIMFKPRKTSMLLLPNSVIQKFSVPYRQ